MKVLLESGLTVHCPVRDPDNEEKIRHLKEAAKGTKGRLKFFKADLLEEGSYLESMKGCSVVFHTASPFVVSVVGHDNIQKQLIDPAVKGTSNVLTSVAQTKSVKRVVLTSSCYACATDAADCLSTPDGIVNEEVWNTTASMDYNPYAYSKVVAEKEAWKIADAQEQYQLVVVNPAWVFGPGLKVHPSSESYQFLKLLGDGTMKSGCADIGCFVVDVRDVAQAHLRAAFTTQAQGRYVCCGHNTSILQFAAPIAEKYPDYPVPTAAFPKPIVWLIAPFIGLNRTQVWRGIGYKSNLDNSKSKKDLGMEYRPVAETYVDMFEQMIQGGMIPKQPVVS